MTAAITSIANTNSTGCVVAPKPRRGHVDVLIIDRDPATVALVTGACTDLKLTLYAASAAADALQLISTLKPALVILGHIMPEVSGMELLEKVLEIDADLDVVLLTGQYSTDSAVDAIQRGAYDYLTKPISPTRLRLRLAKWVGDSDVRKRAARLERELMFASSFEGILGRSPLMLDLFSKMRRIAPHFQTVLVTGETGTGKELIARALHRLSPVASGPFVVCNCAALVETLLESELFGHVKGAFTGATQDKKGLIESADGGTVFLDEIGEMPLTTQVKLLRLIQNREIQRVGSGAVQKVSVRIVAATHRNLKMLANSSFREDLYYRLSVIDLHVPRLLDRREDIPLLEHHFLRSYGARYGKPMLRIGRKAHAVLSRHTWPGNVRELENVIAHACMLAQNGTVSVEDLPETLLQRTVVHDTSPGEMIPLEAAMRRHASRVLRMVGNNRVQAAAVLGISRTTLYRLISSREGSTFGDSPGGNGTHQSGQR
jgi:DNA-binding NtrC family response regulator